MGIAIFCSKLLSLTFNKIFNLFVFILITDNIKLMSIICQLFLFIVSIKVVLFCLKICFLLYLQFCKYIWLQNFRLIIFCFSTSKVLLFCINGVSNQSYGIILSFAFLYAKFFFDVFFSDFSYPSFPRFIFDVFSWQFSFLGLLVHNRDQALVWGADEALQEYVDSMNAVILRNPGKWQRLPWVSLKDDGKSLLGPSVNADDIYRDYLSLLRFS